MKAIDSYRAAAPPSRQGQALYFVARCMPQRQAGAPGQYRFRLNDQVQPEAMQLIAGYDRRMIEPDRSCSGNDKGR